MESKNIELITKMVIDAINQAEDKGNGFMVPIGVSARHVHLTQEHVEALFGPGYQLTKKKDLMGGQFASNEEVGIPSKKTSASHNHGNSLEDTRTNYGYALVDKDTNEILKFGETLNPEKRYSQKYLNENNAVMKVIESGSKRDIHMWQYDMNKYYESKYGEFPPLLKSKGW